MNTLGTSLSPRITAMFGKSMTRGSTVEYSEVLQSSSQDSRWYHQYYDLLSSGQSDAHIFVEELLNLLQV